MTRTRTQRASSTHTFCKISLAKPRQRENFNGKTCVKDLGPEKPSLKLTQQTHEKGTVYQRSFSLSLEDVKTADYLANQADETTDTATHC